MPTVKEVYDFINSFADFQSQEDWDNSGMLVGDFDAEVKKIAVALDITNEAVEKAEKSGANLIVSHHPVIFSGQKSFIKGNVAYELAVNEMNAICCHTPLDMAQGGTNDTLARLLGFNVTTSENPILRYAEIDETTADDLAKHISSVLGTTIRYTDSKKPIKKIAICTGAGCSLIEEAGEIDAFITGDASHHNFLDALENGISVFAAGHYETENLVVPVVVELLKNEFSNVEVFDLEQKNPIKFA